MSERLRCGIIGTGATGLQHLVSLMHCSRAAAVAIAESNARRAKEAADRYRIDRSYTDYTDLLDQPDIDAVTIAVPNHCHARIAVDALQARKHVFLETPMALNLKEATKIAETAKKMKKTVMVGMNFRVHRQVMAVKGLLERGELGEVYHTRCYWLRRRGIPRIGSWYTQKDRAGGGCVADLGGAILDLGCHLMGEFEVRSVSAQTFAKFGPRGAGESDWGRSEVDPKRPFTVEDCGMALLRFKSGRSLILETAWAANLPTEQKEFGIEMLGVNGGLSLFPARVYRPGSTGFETVELNPSADADSDDRLDHFVNAVLDNRKPLLIPAEALKLQRIVDAIYASAKQGREVRLT